MGWVDTLRDFLMRDSVMLERGAEGWRGGG